MTIKKLICSFTLLGISSAALGGEASDTSIRLGRRLAPSAYFGVNDLLQGNNTLKKVTELHVMPNTVQVQKDQFSGRPEVYVRKLLHPTGDVKKLIVDFTLETAVDSVSQNAIDKKEFDEGIPVYLPQADKSRFEVIEDQSMVETGYKLHTVFDPDASDILLDMYLGEAFRLTLEGEAIQDFACGMKAYNQVSSGLTNAIQTGQVSLETDDDLASLAAKLNPMSLLTGSISQKYTVYKVNTLKDTYEERELTKRLPFNNLNNFKGNGSVVSSEDQIIINAAKDLGQECKRPSLPYKETPVQAPRVKLPGFQFVMEIAVRLKISIF